MDKNLRKFFCLRFPTYKMTRWNSGDIAIYMAALLGLKTLNLLDLMAVQAVCTEMMMV
ncbi:MAG: hypothetical protein CM15mV145_320 [uncultured marine virus]|nr:MAG: hypothetical protein CM15mV145_320 [uncultured marine virus]